MIEMSYHFPLETTFDHRVQHFLSEGQRTSATYKISQYFSSVKDRFEWWKYSGRTVVWQNMVGL